MNTTAFVIGLLIIILGPIVYYIVSIFLKEKSEENKRAQALKILPLEILEKKVYRYEPAYFKVIGEDNKSVLMFRKIIENLDIATLSKQCDHLMRQFVKLERKAGHHGRPLIMEYYFDYELHIRELYKRKK